MVKIIFTPLNRVRQDESISTNNLTQAIEFIKQKYPQSKI